MKNGATIYGYENDYVTHTHTHTHITHGFRYFFNTTLA